MKRSIAGVTGVAVLLASAAVAQGAPNIDSGKYKGKTKKGNPITLRVSKSKKLYRFTHNRVKMKCSDGDTFRLEKLSSGNKRLTILDDGKFGFKVEYDNGAYWTVRGKIKGNKATGVLRMKIRFNSNDQPDPDGNIRCTSGKLRFTAKHKR